MMLSEKKERLLITGIFIYSFAVSFWYLLSTSYAAGADGYYYAAQLKHFWERGTFFSGDSSIILKYLMAFSSLFNDYVLSNKIATAFLGSLVLWPAYLLGRKIFGRLSGFLFSAIILSTSLMIYFKVEYIKNLGGIFFFLFFLYFIYCLLENKYDVKKWLLVFLFAILTLLSHKLMGAFALVIILFTILMMMIKRPFISAVVFIITVVAVALLGKIIPNFLHYQDFSRFQEIIFLPGQIPAFSYITLMKPPLTHIFEVLIFLISPIVIFTAAIKKRESLIEEKKYIFLMVILYVSCSIPFIRFDEMDMAFRLFIIVFIPGAFFISLFLKHTGSRTKIIILSCILLYQLFAVLQYKHPSNMDYPIYDSISNKVTLPKNALLIAHQGLDNFYYYKTGIDTFRFLPEKKHKSRPLYRLAFGIHEEHRKKYLKKVKWQMLPGGYLLLKEKDWQDFLSVLPFTIKEKYLHWKNPYLHRPSYMRRSDNL